MDIILYNILTAFICLLIGYFFGSIPTAVWIGKIFFHKDVREFGSKNAGGTNAGRVFGAKVGAIVIIIDILKSYLPVWGAWAILTFVSFGDKPLMADAFTMISQVGLDAYMIQWPVYWLVSIGVIFGHCFPIFAQFKGGKGVSTYAAIIGTSWLFLIFYLISFLVTLKAKKFVSLSSIVSAITSVVVSWTWAILIMCNVIPQDWAWFPMMGWTLLGNWMFAIVTTVGAILLIARHHGNITRLINKTERKISWMK